MEVERMKVDIIILVDDIIESKIEDKIVVVIDMFRVIFVIVIVLNNGCKEVVFYFIIEEILEYVSKFNR